MSTRQKVSHARKTGRMIQSVHRAVKILELLAVEPEGLGLSRLAKRLELCPQTAQSLLLTLEVCAMIAQNEKGGPYTLGSGVHDLSRKWMSGFDRNAFMRKRLRQLADDIGEYVLVALLRGGTLVPLAEASVNQPLMANDGLDFSERLHTMATGKLLMAYLDDKPREKLVASLNLVKRGPRSVTNASDFMNDLKKIRRQKYVVCVEENGAGSAAIAVPVCDADGVVVAALGCAVPLARFPVARRKELREALLDAARTIERHWRAGG